MLSILEDAVLRLELMIQISMLILKAIFSEMEGTLGRLRRSCFCACAQLAWFAGKLDDQREKGVVS